MQKTIQPIIVNKKDVPHAKDNSADNSRTPDENEGKVSWQYFDEKAYIATKRVLPGEDAYKKNKFNQIASDNIKSNRDVPDTRHPR
jgi:polypeptide N-acetylgalactosaminyltransferase